MEKDLGLSGIRFLGCRFGSDTFGQGFRFGVVGIGGMFLGVFFVYVFTEFFGFYYMASAVLAYLLVQVFSFLLDKIWAFRERLVYRFWKSFEIFYLIVPITFFANLFCLYVFTEFFHVHYLISQGIAMFFSGFLKFFLNKIFTFTGEVGEIEK